MKYEYPRTSSATVLKNRIDNIRSHYSYGIIKRMINEKYGICLHIDQSSAVYFTLYGEIDGYKIKDEDWIECQTWQQDEWDNDPSVVEVVDDALWSFFNDPEWLMEEPRSHHKILLEESMNRLKEEGKYYGI